MRKLFSLLFLFTLFGSTFSKTYIGLKQQNLDKLEFHIHDISNPYSKNYGKYMTIQEIDDLISPSLGDRNTVKDHLSQQNVTILQEYSDLLIIDKEVDSLVDEIDFMFTAGKVNTHLLKTNRKNLQTSEVDPGLVGRDVLRRIYQIPNQLVDKSLVSIGPMEYLGGSGFLQDDLMHVEVMNNLPKNPVPKDNIIGKNGFPDGESELDIQLMSQVSANAELWYESFNGWMYEWAVNFYNRQRVPQIVSLSWGWSEENQCAIVPMMCRNMTSKQYVERSNTEFMKLAARGITLVVAAGDAGSPGRTNEVCNQNGGMSPIFPGSSQWVTSVGATYLVADDKHYDYPSKVCKEYVSCANGTIEQGVTYNYTGWTSGAGFDKWTNRPHWQHNVVERYLHSGVELPDGKHWNRHGRAYPDVSAIGHNCLTYEDHAWIPADGTSCSSPIFAAVLTVLNNHQLKNGKPLIGYANPLLYHMYLDDPSTYNDVLKGNSSCTEMMCCDHNLGFKAAKGWDPIGGLGTPNVRRMLEWLDRHIYSS